MPDGFFGAAAGGDGGGEASAPFVDSLPPHITKSVVMACLAVASGLHKVRI